MTARHPRLVCSWIALVAILMLTFAPSVTRALAVAQGPAWVDVCATRPLARAADGSPVPGSPTSLAHCPYCMLQADLAPPPDPRQADARAALVFRARPTGFLGSPHAKAVWPALQARAPPARA